MIRIATLDDIHEIEAMMNAHWADIGDDGMTVNRDEGYAYLYPALSSKYGVAFIADGAFATMGYLREFFCEKQAVVQVFYVCPSKRGTSIARDMAEVLIARAKADGAVSIEASQNSGAKYSRLWHNLWSKQGLVQTGIVMGCRL